MDDQLGPLFEYIRQRPSLRTNTVIIVASDNGPEPGAGSAGPFRGHKGNLYEGGVREPFIVWGPGILSSAACGTVNDTTVVAGVDLLPSLARLAGVALPGGTAFDGEDLSPALLGQTRQARVRPLFWNRPPDRPGDNNVAWPDLAMREGDWKLLIMEDGTKPQLYNLAKDPGEKNNLVDEETAVVQRLRTQLLDWRKRLPIQAPPRWNPNQRAALQETGPS